MRFRFICLFIAMMWTTGPVCTKGDEKIYEIIHRISVATYKRGRYYNIVHARISFTKDIAHAFKIHGVSNVLLICIRS